MTKRYIVKKEALELITDQKTVPGGSTVVILAEDVLEIRKKLAFFETIAKEHKALLQGMRYADNDEGDHHHSRDRETIRVINQKLAIK